MTSSPDDVLSTILASVTSQAGDNLRIIEQYDITIASQRAVVLEYTLTRAPDDAYFSIIAVTLGPDGRGYILQWTSTSENQSEARQLLDNMIPFFQFLP